MRQTLVLVAVAAGVAFAAAPAATPAPRGSARSPSGVPMPVRAPHGWRVVFADDFTGHVPSGAGVARSGDPRYFPQAVATKWGAYPYPWSGTPSWATYFPERTTSIHDGVMDIWLHSEQIDGRRTPLIDAVEPKIARSGQDRYSRLYGRYLIRFRSQRFTGFHASWLLWPKSERWPHDGEIDFPEGDFDSVVSGFVHHQDGTGPGDQDAFTSRTPVAGGWHTATIVWLPGRCSFFLDDRLVGRSTSRVPDTPMRYVIQNNGAASATPASSGSGHVLIDWVVIDAPAR